MSLVLKGYFSEPFILDSKQMKEADYSAINELLIPSRVLMEHAAMACIRDLSKLDSDFLQKKYFVVCGGGNNGLDGVVIGRILSGMGANVSIISLYEIPDDEGERGNIWESFIRLVSDVKVKVCKTRESFLLGLVDIESSSYIIDAISGTGFSTKNQNSFHVDIIKEINSLSELKGVKVLSVDIPSGNSPDEGVITYEGIKAHRTWALQCLKPIHVNPEADSVCGEVSLLEIGIPIKSSSFNYKKNIIQKSHIKKILNKIYPESKKIYKGDRGHVLVIGGAKGKEGAPVLSSLASFRIGAGLISLLKASEKKDIFVPPEIMQIQHSDTTKDTFYGFSEDIIKESLLKKDVIIIGPGMGTDDGAVSLLENVLKCAFQSNPKIPLVIDADALNCISSKHELFKYIGSHCVLTPHYGEFSKLIGVSINEIKASRLSLSKDFCDKHDCTLILKGAYSIISNKNQQYVNSKSVPSLGVAGSGDILSGIIGGLIARGLSVFDSSLVSVYLHTKAGKLWEDKHEISSGMIASEISSFLPKALSKLTNS